MLTGQFTARAADDIFSKPRFSVTGLTDESLSTIKGVASGSVSYEGLEAMEDLSVVLADRNIEGLKCPLNYLIY